MADSEELDKQICYGCGLGKVEPEHPCPYTEEIHDDPETLCNCCKDCQAECAMDI